MPINPWEKVLSDKSRIAEKRDQNIDSILFIIDAANQVEEKLLRTWLQETKQRTRYSGSVSIIVVQIGHDLENIDSDKLSTALVVESDTVLVPLRVVWKSKLDNPNIADVDKPRWRDLLRGNPRKPSRRKAEKILASDPTRAVCVMGVPASLAWLKAEFEERQKNAILDKNLAEFVANQASLALEIAERRLRGSRYKVPRQVARRIQVSDRYKR
ncbi:MAG: hypothetical protein KTR16_10790, partial [Acidiferrobacterales bacterium]|nr:hypothetical protein [Acidiferrobacterales bacterium]